MAKRPATPLEKRWRKAERRLGVLNFTPQTAERLAKILCSMADSPDREGVEVRLRAFGEIAREPVKRP